MYVCMHVCIYVCMHVRMYVDMYVSMYVWIYVCISETRKRVYICIGICICVYVCHIFCVAVASRVLPYDLGCCVPGSPVSLWPLRLGVTPVPCSRLLPPNDFWNSVLMYGCILVRAFADSGLLDSRIYCIYDGYSTCIYYDPSTSFVRVP